MLRTLLTYINKRDLVYICVVLGTDHYCFDKGVGVGGGGGWEIFTGKKNIILCLRFPANTFFFFTCIQFISVFTASATNYFKIFNLPPPVKKIMVRPLLNLGMKNRIPESAIFFFFHKIRQQKTNVLVARLYYATVKFLLRQFFSF